MKRKLLLIAALCSLLLLLLPACDVREAGSLKSLTRPYIAQYGCTEATIGGENLFDTYEYIEIILVNKEEMQLIYKPKNGQKHTVEGTYTFNTDTRELTADIGILGYKFRESATVERGRFTISKSIGKKQLIMKFKSK